jgi:putative heme iron utilization protein
MRITIIGTMQEAPEARERYLAVHPAAALYAGFADFSFWRLEPESVHAVAGFGRISTFPGQDMLLPSEAAAAFAAIEPGATRHMNEDHTDVIADFARMLGQPAGEWRMATADLDGLDLVSAERTVRLPFPEPLPSPDRLRPVLIEMAKAARVGS